MRKTAFATRLLTGLALSLALVACGSDSDKEDDKDDMAVGDMTDKEMVDDDALMSDMADKDMMESDMMESDMADKDLMESDLMESDLMESDMMESDMMESDMMESDMMESDMMESDMMESDGMAEDVSGADVAAPMYDLTFSGTGFAPHDSQNFFVAVVDQGDMSILATDFAVIADGAFSFSFAGVLAEGGSYYVDYYADFDGSGACDSPPTDHVWRSVVDSVGDDVVLEVTHNTDFEAAACASFVE